MALNAYENDGGSECLCKWWLWTLMKKMMALNAYENDGEKFDKFYKGDIPQYDL